MKKIILLLIILLTLTACDTIKETAEDFKNSDTGEVTTDDISDAFGSIFDKFTDEEFGLDDIRPLIGSTLKDSEVLKFWDMYSKIELNLDHKDMLNDKSSGDSYSDVQELFEEDVKTTKTKLDDNIVISYHLGEKENIRFNYYFTKDDELYLSGFYINPVTVDKSILIEDKFMFSDIYRLRKIIELDKKPQLLTVSNFKILDTDVYTLFFPELKENKIILNELTHNAYGVAVFHFLEDITDRELNPLELINNNYLKTIELVKKTN